MTIMKPKMMIMKKKKDINEEKVMKVLIIKINRNEKREDNNGDGNENKEH